MVGACAAAACSPWPGCRRWRCGRPRTPCWPLRAEQSPALYVAGLLGAALSAAYAAKALVVLTRALPEDAESRWDDEREGTRAVPTAAWLPLLPLAAGAVVLGVLALPPLSAQVHDLVGGAAAGARRGRAAGLGAARGRGRRRDGGRDARRRAPAGSSGPRVLTDWLFLERLAHRVVVRPVEALARPAGPPRRRGARPRRRRRPRGARRSRLRADAVGASLDDASSSTAPWCAASSSGVRRAAAGLALAQAADRAAPPVLPPSAGRAGPRPRRPRPREVNVLSVLVFLPAGRRCRAAAALGSATRVARGAFVVGDRGRGARSPRLAWASVRHPGGGRAGARGAGAVDPGRGVELPRRRRRAVPAAGGDDHARVPGLRGLRAPRAAATPAAGGAVPVPRGGLPGPVRLRRPDPVLRLLRPLDRGHVLLDQRVGARRTPPGRR